MKTTVKTIAALLLAVVTFGLVDIAAAHHSFAMFDRSRELVKSGTVARWQFNSPHVVLYIINDEDGQVWGYEGAAPASLLTRGQGMNGFTFQPDDHVTLVVCPLVDGRNGGALGFIIKDGDEETFDNWYRANDGGCGPSQDWGEWLPMGYKTRAEAEEAMDMESDE